MSLGSLERIPERALSPLVKCKSIVSKNKRSRHCTESVLAEVN